MAKRSARQNPIFVVKKSQKKSGGELNDKERITIIVGRLLGWSWNDVALGGASVFRSGILDNGDIGRLRRTNIAAGHSFRKFVDDHSLDGEGLTFNDFISHPRYAELSKEVLEELKENKFDVQVWIECRS